MVISISDCDDHLTRHARRSEPRKCKRCNSVYLWPEEECMRITLLPALLALSTMGAAQDYPPIALVTADPTVLVVRADSKYKELKDFVDAAKANPGKINYSSSGVYGTLHVAMEIFANAAGIKLFHVPYQGGGPAVTALLGGQVEALAPGPPAAIRQSKGRQMRALASWSDKRLKLLPDHPTFKELGYDAEFYI